MTRLMLTLLASLACLPCWGQGVSTPVNFQPQAPVILHKPSGRTIGLGVAAANSAAVGTAMLAARTAAVSGDLIEVNADAILPSQIAKNGVNWVFGPVDVSMAVGPILDDGNTEMDFSVSGSANFTTTTGVVANLENLATEVHWEFNAVHALGAGAGGIRIVNATLRLNGYSVVSDFYDGIYIEGDGKLYPSLELAQGHDGGLSLEGDAETVVGRIGRLVGGSLIGSSAGLQIQSSDHTLQLSGESIQAGGSGYAITGLAAGVVNYRTITGLVSMGGSARLVGAVIDGSATNTAPVTIQSNGATLEDCRLIKHASQANYIAASSARTLNIYGHLAPEGAALSNVTLTYVGRVGDAVRHAGKAAPSGDIVGTTDAQTITNKTLTGPKLTAAGGAAGAANAPLVVTQEATGGANLNLIDVTLTPTSSGNSGQMINFYRGATRVGRISEHGQMVLAGYYGLGASGDGADVFLVRSGASVLDVRDSTFSALGTMRMGGHATQTVSKTATYTATFLDHTILCDATSGSFDVDLPAAATYPGITFVIKKTTAANTVSIDPNGAELIDGSGTSIGLTTQWSGRVIQSNGTSWFVIGTF